MIPVVNASTLVDWSTNDGAGTMDRVLFFRVNRTHFVNRLADNIDNPTESFAADRHRDLLAGIDGILATNQTVGRIHGDGPDDIFTEMLGNFQHQVVLLVIDRRIGNPERIVDGRQFARLEFVRQ